MSDMKKTWAGVVINSTRGRCRDRLNQANISEANAAPSGNQTRQTPARVGSARFPHEPPRPSRDSLFSAQHHGQISVNNTRSADVPSYQARENDVCRISNLPAPIGHPPTQNRQSGDSSVPSVVLEGLGGDGMALHHGQGWPVRRNQQPRTRSGHHTNFNAPRVTPRSSIQTNQPEIPSVSALHLGGNHNRDCNQRSHFNQPSASNQQWSVRSGFQCPEYTYNTQYTWRNIYNPSSSAHRMYHPSTVYNFNYNITPYHVHFEHLLPPSQRTESPTGTGVHYSMTVPLSYPNYGQITPNPRISQGYVSPNHAQYEEMMSQQVHYQNTWQMRPNLLNHSSTIQPASQSHRSLSAQSHALWHSSFPHQYHPSIMATNPVEDANTASFEPLYHSPIWGPLQSCDLPWADGNLTSQFSGAVDQPLDLSYYSGYNQRSAALSYLSNSSLYSYLGQHGLTSDISSQDVTANPEIQGAHRVNWTLEIPAAQQEDSNATANSSNDRSNEGNSGDGSESRIAGNDVNKQANDTGNEDEEEQDEASRTNSEA